MQILNDKDLEKSLTLARRLFNSDAGVVCDLDPQLNPRRQLFEGELDFVVELSYLNGETIEYFSFTGCQDAQTFIARVCDHPADIQPWENFTNAPSTT